MLFSASHTFEIVINQIKREVSMLFFLFCMPCNVQNYVKSKRKCHPCFCFGNECLAVVPAKYPHDVPGYTNGAIQSCGLCHDGQISALKQEPDYFLRVY